MSGGVRIRPAAPDDPQLLGAMMVEAGGGIFEVLLEGAGLPGMTPAEMMAEAARQQEGAFSYRRVIVIECDGVVAGGLTVFPADLFERDVTTAIPADRQIYPRQLSVILDPGSWYVAAMALRPERRGQRLRGRLLRATFAQAGKAGFDRATLLVWASNLVALGLYLRLRFVEAGHCRVPALPLLRHGDVMLALTRPL